MTQEVLKLALEFLEDNQDLIEIYERPEYLSMYKTVINKCKEALAQRTEPPAWFPAVENILKEYGLQAMDFVADFKEAMKDAEQSPRTWVGLTDVEIDYLLGSTVGENEETHIAFARAIEAKLKELNGYSI